MGMYISFTRVTPEELDRAEKDPEWASEFLYEVDELRPDDPDGDLDKAWAGLQYLLDAAEAEIEFEMNGFPIGDSGELSGWTVHNVQEAAKELRALPFERLAVHYDADRMNAEDVYPMIWDSAEDDGLEFLREYYEILVTFFEATAASKSAAIMNFSF